MIIPQMSREDINALPPFNLPETTDYHNFSHRGSDEAHRKKFDIGPLYLNAATCLVCGYFIRSRNRRDFVTCRCGSTSVDGGSWYAKRVGKPENMVDHIETFQEMESENESPLPD